MGRYLGMFAAYYFGYTVLCVVVLSILDWIVGSSTGAGAGVSTVIPLAAAGSVGSHFTRDHRRLPGDIERGELVAWSYVISLVYTLIIGLVVFAGAMVGDGGDVLTDVPALVFAFLGIAFVISLVLNYVMIRLGYGWMTRRSFDAMQRKARTSDPASDTSNFA